MTTGEIKKAIIDLRIAADGGNMRRAARLCLAILNSEHTETDSPVIECALKSAEEIGWTPGDRVKAVEVHEALSTRWPKL